MLNSYGHFIIIFLSIFFTLSFFNNILKYQLFHAFDHICMEKAPYKFFGEEVAC